MPLTPNNREEHWLQGMVDGQTTLEPNKRREYWYKEIVDAIGSGGGGGGTGGGVLIVHESDSAFDKTWQEIFDALSAGQIVISLTLAEDEATMAVLYAAYKLGSKYCVDMYSYSAESSFVYKTLSADGYPVFVE